MATAVQPRQRGSDTNDPDLAELNLGWSGGGKYLCVEVHDGPIDFQERGTQLARAFAREIDQRLAEIAKRPELAALRDLEERWIKAGVEIREQKAEIARLTSADAVDDKEAAAVRVAIEKCHARVTEAELRKNTVNRLIGPSREQCEAIIRAMQGDLCAEFAHRVVEARIEAAHGFYKVAESALIKLSAVQTMDRLVDALPARLQQLLGVGEHQQRTVELGLA